MRSTAKKLAVCAALLGLLACGTATAAAAATDADLFAENAGIASLFGSSSATSIETGSYTNKMLLGATQQLNPTVKPSNSGDGVVFVSDDTSILTVTSSGQVTAVGVGTATITAAAGDQLCAYTIVVSMDESMIVTEMDLSLSSNTIYVGNSVSASLQVRPSTASNYATVSLTSSNDKVATVNSFGRVTGVAPGKATITATCGSVTASTTVTVIALPVDETTGTATTTTTASNSGQVVKLATSYVTLKPGATHSISAKVTPSSASQKLTYKSANTSVAVVSDSGVITGVGTGATSVTVSNGTASAMVTVIVNRSASSEAEQASSSAADTAETVEVDPVIKTINESSDKEVIFAQSEVPVITGDILSTLHADGKDICIVADDYTIQVSGSDVKSTEGQIDTNLVFTSSDEGVEMSLNEGSQLPCRIKITVEGDKAGYKRLYLYNTTKDQWQYLNSYVDGTITVDTAGRYVLTNKDLKYDKINYTFFILGGVVVVAIGVVYIAVKKRYWFW